MKRDFKRRFFSLTLVLSLIYTMNSCGIGFLVRGVVKGSLEKEKNTVPKDFIDDDQTLIIMEWGPGGGGYDQYSKKAFMKFYKGKKRFVTFDELEDSKYEDMEKYRFIFSQGRGSKEMYSGGDASFTYSGSRPFHIYDRLEDKSYQCKIVSGMYFRVMQAYAMKLEKFRSGAIQ